MQFACKVTKVKGYYFYTYKFKNLSEKKTMFFGWEVLDRAAYGFSGPPIWWELKPGEEKKVLLKHKEPPVSFWGMARIMNKANADDVNRQKNFSDVGVTLPPGIFYHVDSFGQPGPLLASYTKK